MFLNMPRSVFGDVQARLFPKMGMVCSGSSLLALASYSLVHPVHDSGTLLLATSLACGLLNTFVVIPWTSSLMFDRRKFDKGSEEEKKASAKFGMAHGVSVLAVIVSLGCSLAYTNMLAKRVVGSW